MIKIIACFIAVVVPVLSPAQTPLDVIKFGDAVSEKSHFFSDTLSETYTGDLGEKARRMLPQNPAYYYGGSMTFKVAVDPAEQNFFTGKLSGNEFDASSDNGRMLLVCEGKEVGSRHGGSEIVDVFVDQSGAAASKGAFYYRTVPLPKSLTKGKTTVTIKIRSSGRLYAYGTAWNYNSFQRNLLKPTRGLYRVYTHTNPYLTVPGDDKQGAVPSYSSAPANTGRGPEYMEQYKTKCNNRINGFLNSKGYLKPVIPNNYWNSIHYLAKAYSIAWTSAYKNPAVIQKVLSSIDSNCYYFNQNNQNVNAWGGAYGYLGDAIHLLYAQLQPRLNEVINLGTGPKPRWQYWSGMLKASFNNGRFNRRTITNQDFECVISIYGANKGLLKIDPASSLTEAQAKRYLYEAAGLAEWRGDDLPAGGSEFNFGRGFTMMTAKGTTHEPGWVAQDCYGNLGPGLIHMFQLTGDSAFIKKAVALEKSMAYFRYPLVDEKGNKAILAEGVICWRNAYHPGHLHYGNINVAAVSKDPVLIGYIKQFISDKHFFDDLNDHGIEGSEALDIPDYYNFIAAASGNIVNPCTPGQPDYAYADEENGVLAVKRGLERFFIMLYRRAYSVNYLAKAHHITPDNERVIDFFIDDVRFKPSGKYLIRDGLVEAITDGPIPDKPEGSTKGVKEHLPLLDDGTTHENRCIARYYQCKYGNYLIGMNTTSGESYEMNIPASLSNLKDLVSGRTLSSPVIVGPKTTVVFILTPAQIAAMDAMPKMPLAVTGTAGNKNNLVSWDMPLNADSFYVYRSLKSGGPYLIIGKTNSQALADTAVANGTSYFYTVRSRNKNGLSAASIEVKLTPDAAGTLVLGYIPGKVEAENYLYQGGIQTENTIDAGGGKNLSFIGPGDWTEYWVKVAKSGTYKLDFRTANNVGTITIQDVNMQVLGIVTTIKTTGNQNWATSAVSVNLNQGLQLIRLTYSGGFNLNWFSGALINTTDCNNTVNGTAFLDECNICSGGTTGKNACKDIADGNYLIKPMHSGLCLETGLSVTQQNCTGILNQVWKLTKKDNYYQIQNTAGQYLSYSIPNSGSGITVSSANKNYLWRLEDAGNKSYTLVPSGNLNLAADVASNTSSPGKELLLYNRSGANNQKFIFQASLLSIEEQIIEDDIACHPNPFSHDFIINYNGGGDFIYTITDLSGYEIDKGHGNNYIKVGSRLKSGLYMIGIQNGKGNKIFKIIKN